LEPSRKIQNPRINSEPRLRVVKSASASGNPDFLKVRFVSLLLTSLALFLGDRLSVLTLFIVLGQGHFFSTYFFQFKSGKITKKYLAVYAFAALVLGVVFLGTIRPEILVVTTSIYFVIHFMRDEIHHLETQKNRSAGLNILPVILGYTGILLSLKVVDFTPYLLTMRFDGGIFPGAALYFMLMALGVFLYKAYSDWKDGSVTNPRNGYFHACSLALFAVYLSGIPLYAEQVMGFIILYHYSNWYLHYYFKLKTQPVRQKTYLRDVILVNLFTLALYYFTARSNLMPVPDGFIFMPYFFYIWTLLHLVATERKADLVLFIPRFKK
jgi:hypothetical protein